MAVFEKLDSLNPVNQSKSKFKNLEGLDLQRVDRKVTKNDTHDDLVVVAHVWDDLRYAKYLYLSLISAYRFTDIKEFDVHLFFSTSLKEHENELRDLFLPFVKDISFKEKRFKYFTSFYSEIESYEFVTHLDSDLFFCGNKQPFFNNLREFYWEFRNNDRIAPYVCFNFYPYRTSEFRVCDHLERQLDLDSYEEVKDWIVRTSPMQIEKEDLERWIEEDRWPWNVFYSYDLKAFTHESFYELIQWWYNETKEWWEEEKAYWFWMNNNDFPYVPLSRVLHDKQIEAINPYFFEEKIPEGISIDDYMELNKLEVRNTLKDIKWENEHCLYIVHPFEYHDDLMGKNETTREFLQFIVDQSSKL